MSLPRAIVLLLLLFLIGAGAIPHYLSGQWSGSTQPKVEGLKPLQTFVQGKLPLTGWETIEGRSVRIGEYEWFQQVLRQVTEDSDLSSSPKSPLQKRPREAIVLLRGQKGQRERPQVEWTDLRGDRQWQEDSLDTLTVGSTTARWFRAWWQTESGAVFTLAAAQWYAWPAADSRGAQSGQWTGHWSSNVWFWQDWQHRWQGQRSPWLAVVILIPIEPLGDIAEVEPEVRSLIQHLQTALGQAVLSE